jgi:AbrB family looped-hinge helix DNA binding protein
MKTTLDRFGRVVVPKTLRDQLGLRAGAVIEIEEDDGRIMLRPVDDESPLIARDGILVFNGSALGDLENSVAAHREERARYISGLKSR